MTYFYPAPHRYSETYFIIALKTAPVLALLTRGQFNGVTVIFKVIGCVNVGYLVH
jgi:hypothetical protein